MVDVWQYQAAASVPRKKEEEEKRDSATFDNSSSRAFQKDPRESEGGREKHKESADVISSHQSSHAKDFSASMKLDFKAGTPFLLSQSRDILARKRAPLRNGRGLSCHAAKKSLQFQRHVCWPRTNPPFETTQCTLTEKRGPCHAKA